eukprot:TRINITY_DN1312_c0_g1_i1.p1 TRINITY_DN1312_c0_g1~~TRINITY_DN1312_c0_g1_i1.p1  ORF type:complete len:788 (-),score=210.99 TRINITY_DN1312_c0_g1_i1:384-2747(-)
MPPRSAKKTPLGPRKSAAKSAKGTPKSQNQQNQSEVAAEETPKKIEEVSETVSVVEIKEEIKVEEIIEEKPSEPEPESEPKPKDNGTVSVKEEDDVTEAFNEEDQGERLDLEDNEPEYEEAEVFYDEKEIDGDDDPEEGDEAAEEGEEGDAGVEEEGDMVEEDIEDGGEDIEGEEDDENVEEEHEDIADGEEEEHHDVVKERRKRKEFEVFVGGLDKEASEDDLKKVFSEVGEITEVRLMMNPLTKKNKGFAFLRFATVEQAKRAVSELKNPVVNGKQCGVTPSQDSDTLFLGNICKTWTKDALKEKLKHYGIETVEDLTLVEDTNNVGMNRGFAFLEFSSRSDAMDAYKRLQKRDIVFGVDRTAKVAFADSFIEPDDEIMQQVKTIFVDGLPASWDEDRVKEHLKKFGEIEKIELARNMPSAKRKDFGFVSFVSHDAAVACAEGINNSELGEGDHKVKIRARLSRPHQRGRVKRIRGDYGFGGFGRGAPRGGRGSWGRSIPHRFSGRGFRGIGVRGSPMGARGFKRPFGYKDRRSAMVVTERVRNLAPPERSYSRRPPVPAYPKSSSKRDYGRREELPPRSRAAARVAAGRRSSYRDDYSFRASGYPDTMPRSASRTAARRSYEDEGYGRRLERPPPSYRETRGRDYDMVSGAKRPYSALDDVPSRYTDASFRQSRARLDYGVSGSSSQYDDAYGDRLGRSHLGYGGSSSLTGQESHGLYGSRQSMSYGGGSLSGSGVGGIYSSSFGSDYLSRGSDVGSGSYSSLYSGRSSSGSGYLGGSGSGSYY